MRLIEIVTEFQATLAAIGPNIIFPWGWAAAIAAANKAIASTAEVMTELQTTLGAEAAETTAAGAPVDVTGARNRGWLPAGRVGFTADVDGHQRGAGRNPGGHRGGVLGKSSGRIKLPVKPPRGQRVPSAAPVGGGVPPYRREVRGGGGAWRWRRRRGRPRRGRWRCRPMVQPETGTTSTQSATVRASGGAAAVGGAGMMGAPYAPDGGGQGAQRFVEQPHRGVLPAHHRSRRRDRRGSRQRGTPGPRGSRSQ